MRIRSIRPEFWASEDIAELDWHHRLIFIGLWSYVDDNGVGRDDERLIAAALFPLDDDRRDVLMRIHGALTECSKRSLISRYTVDGKPYLHVTTFAANQVINRPSRHRYPAPTCDNAVPSPILTEDSVSPHESADDGEGEKGRRGEGEKGKERGAARSRQTRIPSAWTPNSEHQTRALKAGIDLNREAEKFRAYNEEKDRTAASWNAAFTRWLINAAEYAARDSRTGRPAASRVDQNLDVVRHIAARDGLLAPQIGAGA